MGRAVAAVASFAVAVVLASPAQAASADLSVYRVPAAVSGVAATTVRDQETVIFRAYARNNGPGASDMYVMYTNTRHLAIVSEACIVPASESGDVGNVTPDTPSCEWTGVPEGDYAIVRVKAIVVGQPGRVARITFCSSNGQGTDDANPANDCRPRHLTIVAG